MEEDDLKKKEEKHTQYDFEPELDNDIVNTNKHMTAAEEQYAAAEKKAVAAATEKKE